MLFWIMLIMIGEQYIAQGTNLKWSPSRSCNFLWVLLVIKLQVLHPGPLVEWYKIQLSPWPIIFCVMKVLLLSLTRNNTQGKRLWVQPYRDVVREAWPCHLDPFSQHSRNFSTNSDKRFNWHPMSFPKLYVFEHFIKLHDKHIKAHLRSNIKMIKHIFIKIYFVLFLHD